MMTEYRICAVRGRSDGPWHESRHRQRLEIGGGVSNPLTTVAKDNYLIEIGETEDEDNRL